MSQYKCYLLAMLCDVTHILAYTINDGNGSGRESNNTSVSSEWSSFNSNLPAVDVKL